MKRVKLKDLKISEIKDFYGFNYLEFNKIYDVELITDNYIRLRGIPYTFDLIIFEEVKEKLTCEERDYLYTILKPFRKRFDYLVIKPSLYEDSEYLKIELDNTTMTLPIFKKGIYYKGLSRVTEYTLKDLGINYEN